MPGRAGLRARAVLHVQHDVDGVCRQAERWQTIGLQGRATAFHKPKHSAHWSLAGLRCALGTAAVQLLADAHECEMQVGFRWFGVKTRWCRVEREGGSAPDRSSCILVTLSPSAPGVSFSLQ